MPDHVRRTIQLAGHFRGKTIKIHGHQFVKGLYTAEGPAKEVEGVCTYLERGYQALPVGDPRIAVIDRATQEKEDGERQLPKGEGGGPAESLRDDLRPPGDETPEVQRDNGGGTAGGGGGGTGSLPIGDGHTDPRVPPKEEGPDAKRLREAVASLDPTVDEHWTKTGTPDIAALESKLGSGSVTRKGIDTVAKNYTREIAGGTKD